MGRSISSIKTAAVKSAAKSKLRPVIFLKLSFISVAVRSTMDP